MKNKTISEYESIDEKNLDLEKIIDEYSGYIYTIIQNMSANIFNQEDIEEIISDTFFILWKNQNKIDKEKSLSSYIAGIARNLVKEKLRKTKNNQNINELECDFFDIQMIDLEYENREKIEIIKNTMEKMKEQDKDIFNLYYYGNRKINEISKILKIAEFNVKSRLHRIRKKLKNELLKGGYSDEY